MRLLKRSHVRNQRIQGQLNGVEVRLQMLNKGPQNRAPNSLRVHDGPADGTEHRAIVRRDVRCSANMFLSVLLNDWNGPPGRHTIVIVENSQRFKGPDVFEIGLTE